jgi:hypothetical protein
MRGGDVPGNDDVAGRSNALACGLADNLNKSGPVHIAHTSVGFEKMSNHFVSIFSCISTNTR